MRRFAAQYIITGTGEILKKATIAVDDNDMVTSINDFGGSFRETPSTEFHNGIIVPGFINCHCHLELSGMKGVVERDRGLGNFLHDIRDKRPRTDKNSEVQIRMADRAMYESGIQACIDICNTTVTFSTKEDSRISYINMLEIFGIDPAGASRRIEEVIRLKDVASEYATPSYITPHSLYSMSVPLLENVLELTADNPVTSIHFMESGSEKELMENAEGNMMDSYRSMGITEEMLTSRVTSHVDGIFELVTGSGNLILVHNTYISENDVNSLMMRGNTFWCLCPGSNLYIENRLPPVELLRQLSAEIVIGTDSLASNESLDMIRELYILQEAFPGLALPEMIGWATFNGAKAMGIGDTLGTIRPGTKPGLILLENVDLENLKLTSHSHARRLI